MYALLQMIQIVLQALHYGLHTANHTTWPAMNGGLALSIVILSATN